MKKPHIIFVAFITIAIIVIVSCSKLGNANEVAIKSIETRTAGVTYTVVDTPYSFSLTITFYTDGTNSLSTSEKASIGTYLNSRFSSLNFSSVSQPDAAFSYDPNDDFYEKVTLYGIGLDIGSNEHPIAFVFHDDGDGTGGTISLTGSGTGTQHSCTGAPCDCCDFIYKEYLAGWGGKQKFKRIIGCQCKITPAACFILDGRCNHTVSEVN